MRRPVTLAAVLGLLAAMLATETATGQPYTLRHRTDAGQVANYERALRTETVLQAAERTERSATAMEIPRREVLVQTRKTPAGVLAVAFEAPSQERLTSLERDGKDKLSEVPEEERVRARPPTLLMTWQGPRGEPIEKPEPPKSPFAVIELTFAEMRYLPEQPVKPGDTWTNDLVFGETQAKITTKFVETRTVKSKPCAVLESKATLALPEEWAKSLDIQELSFKTLVPLDGGPEVEFSGTVRLVQKQDGGEVRRVQRFATTLLKEERLEGAALQKVAADAASIQNALQLAKDDKLDEATTALEAFLKENPKGEWNAAVQLIGMEIAREKAMTKPMPPERLRLALRNLQNARDMAASRGNPQEKAQLDRTLSQIATVNVETLLAESQNPDPIVRDLATFGLSFARTDAALKRLAQLVGDVSGQIRGSALLGLAVRGVPVEEKVLATALKDNDVRARGAAALLAIQTLKREDPVAADILPLLRENMKLEHPWSRMNTLLALGALAPLNSAATVRAIVDALAKETQENLKPTYLSALKQMTGIDAKEVGPYEEWLKKRPADEKPPPAKPPAKPPADEKPKPKG